MINLALAALVLGPLPAEATVSGEVTLGSGKVAKSAVVFLQGEAKSKPLGRTVIDQRDRSFVPHVKIVTVGTTVDFPNNDVIFHNVFSEYHNTKFDFGMYPRGKSKKQTFDRPGVAVLLCSIHPEMGAYVYCVDTPYYALTDKNGRFQIPNVEDGEYEVCVWHESGETYRAKVKFAGSLVLKLKTKR